LPFSAQTWHANCPFKTLVPDQGLPDARLQLFPRDGIELLRFVMAH
jgi:hypothetical protein